MIDSESKQSKLNDDNDILKEWIYVDKRTKDMCSKKFSSPLRKFFEEVFLPRGFPESVHADYVPYQIWDTVQAFASTILGTLTTHSIMRGVGVGESTATPLAAAITWILKDGTGMIGRIAFAWWTGPELDAQCKKWRLFADVLNDLAMGIELSLPYFSSHSTIVLCVSSVMRSLVGVAGGATRAAITQHQALDNNLADVSAKDGSQETCVNLVASLVGIFILSYLNASSFVGVYYVVLVAVHVYANYSAVRSLRFNTFNEDRLALVVRNYLTKSIILSPDEINRRESVLLFQRPSKKLCGFDIVIGGSLEKIKSLLTKESSTCDAVSISGILRAHREKKYLKKSNEFPPTSWMIIPDYKTSTIFVVLDQDVEPNDIMNSYFEAYLTGISVGMHGKIIPTLPGQIAEERVKWSKLLDNSGWIRERNLLPVGPYRSYWNPPISTRDQ